MPHLTCRINQKLWDRLDAVAAARGVDRSRALRQIIEEATVERTERSATADLDELLSLMTERARDGNVPAIRWLAEREEKLQRGNEGKPEDPFGSLDELAPRRSRKTA